MRIWIGGDRPVEPIEIGRRPTLPSLTAVRFVAASLVFLHHVEPIWRRSDNAFVAEVFFLPGNTGVSLFFILSGFVLYWSHRGQELQSFYLARLARVYPAYLFVGAVAILLYSLTDAHSASSLIEDLFTLTAMQSWIPSASWFTAGNYVGWSLSTELFFYATFPVFVGFFLRSSRQRLVWLSVATVILCFGFALLFKVPAAGQVEVEGSLGYYLLYIFPPVRLAEFLFGLSLAALLSHGVRLPGNWMMYAVLAFAAYVSTNFVALSWALTACTFVPYGLLIFALGQRDLEIGIPAQSRLRSGIDSLGRWSYSFYLVHTIVLNIALPGRGVDVRSEAFRVLFVSLVFAVAWLVAGFVYGTVERPAERSLRRRLQRPS